MGIRIHKVMGYSMAINPEEKEALNDALRETYSIGFKELDKTVKKHKPEILKFYADNFPWSRTDKPDELEDHEWDFGYAFFEREGKAGKLKTWRLDDCLSYEDPEYPEEGEQAILTIIPLSHSKEWSRYDNTLDHYDEQYDTDGKPVGGRNHIKWLSSCGLYPWLGMVRIAPPPDGMYKNDELARKAKLLEPATWSMMVGQWDPSQPSTLSPGAFEHFTKDYRPQIPLGVAIPFWTIKNGFKNPSVAYNSLRPAIHTFWR